MSLLDLKFKEEDFTGKDISSLPDAPSAMGMSAQELKARFDMVPKILIAMGAFNDLLDELDENGADAINLTPELDAIKDRITALENAETPRQESELERIGNELVRISNENARIDSENTRGANELERQGNEVARGTDEVIRKSNESARQSNESIRTVNESGRVSAENARQAMAQDLSVWGEYDTAVSYKPLNKAFYLGSSFVCKVACTGIAPTNTTYWQMIASRGLDGEGSGDMLKMVYDTNDNGNVDTADNALKLGGVAASLYALDTNIPTKVSDLNNDVGFITLEEVPELPVDTIDNIDDTVTSPVYGNAALGGKLDSIIAGGGNYALVQIITTPSRTVTVTQGATVKTATSNSLGVAEFELGLGFWDVVAEATYKILIEQTGRLYTLTAADKLDMGACSWGLIDLLGKQGIANQYFSIGDTKNIVIAGETVTCQLMDFGHDDLSSGGKAKMTFMFMNTLANRTMNATQINTTSWKDSLMRSTHIPNIKANIPADLLAVVKKVNKKTATAGNNGTLITTSDDFWLPSSVEVFGAEATTSYAGEGTKYPLFTDTTSRIKKLGNSGNANNWWTRSPYNVNNNTTGFVYVHNGGTITSSIASTSFGVVLGFCV